MNQNLYMQFLICFVKIGFIEELSKWLVLNVIT